MAWPPEKEEEKVASPPEGGVASPDSASLEVTPEAAAQAIAFELDAAKAEMAADSGEHAGAAEVISSGHGAEIKKITEDHVAQAEDAAERAQKLLDPAVVPGQARAQLSPRPYPGEHVPGTNLFDVAPENVSPVSVDAIPHLETDAVVPAGFEVAPGDPFREAAEVIADYVGGGKALDDIDLASTREEASIRIKNLGDLANHAANAIDDIERYIGDPDRDPEEVAKIGEAKAKQEENLASARAQIREAEEALRAIDTVEHFRALPAQPEGEEDGDAAVDAAPVESAPAGAAPERGPAPGDPFLDSVRDAYVDAEESLKRFLLGKEANAAGDFAPKLGLGQRFLDGHASRQREALFLADEASQELLRHPRDSRTPEEVIREILQGWEGDQERALKNLGIESLDSPVIAKIGDLARAKVNYSSARADLGQKFLREKMLELSGADSSGLANFVSDEEEERIAAEATHAMFERFVAGEYEAQLARRMELLEKSREQSGRAVKVVRGMWEGTKSAGRWWRERSELTKIGISLVGGVGIGVATGGVASALGIAARAGRIVATRFLGEKAAEKFAAGAANLYDRSTNKSGLGAYATEREADLEESKAAAAEDAEYHMGMNNQMWALQEMANRHEEIMQVRAKMEKRRNIARALGAVTGAALVGGATYAASSVAMDAAGAAGEYAGVKPSSTAVVPEVQKPAPVAAPAEVPRVAAPAQDPSIFSRKHAPDLSQLENRKLPQSVVPESTPAPKATPAATPESSLGAESAPAETPQATPAPESVKPAQADPSVPKASSVPETAAKPSADVSAEQARVKAEGFEITKENNSIWKAVEHQVSEYVKRPDADYAKLGIKQEELLELQQNPASKESARIVDRITARAITANNLQNMGIKQVGERVLWTPDGKILVTEGGTYRMGGVPAQEAPSSRPRAAVPADRPASRVVPSEPVTTKRVDTVLEPQQKPQATPTPDIEKSTPVADADVPQVEEVEIQPGEEWKVGLYQSQAEAAAPKIKLLEVRLGMDLDGDGIAGIPVRDFMAIDSKLPDTETFAVRNSKTGEYFQYTKGYRNLERAMEADPNWRPRPEQLDMKVRDFVKNRIAETGRTEVPVQEVPAAKVVPPVEKPAVPAETPAQQKPFQGLNPVKAQPATLSGYNPVKSPVPDLPPPPPRP